MCFGPEASFSSGALLVVVGVATLSKVEKKQEILFAAIPLIFGLHQIIEGFLWLTLENGGSPDTQKWLAFGFLIVAFFLWPIYAPLSVYLIENSKRRRSFMVPIIILGVGVAGYLLFTILWNGHSATIVNSCIYYDFYLPFSEIDLTFLYVTAAFGATLLSSERSVILIGLVNLIFCGLTTLIYYKTFISVWCFFASLLSFMIYAHFRKIQSRALK